MEHIPACAATSERRNHLRKRINKWLIGGFKVDPTLPSICDRHHTEQQITFIEVNDVTGWYVCS
jgi:hypothetical protein